MRIAPRQLWWWVILPLAPLILGLWDLPSRPWFGIQVEQTSRGWVVASVEKKGVAEGHPEIVGSQLVEIDGINLGKRDLESDCEFVDGPFQLSSSVTQQRNLGMQLGVGKPTRFRFLDSLHREVALVLVPTPMPWMSILGGLLPSLFCGLATLFVAGLVFSCRPDLPEAKLFWIMACIGAGVPTCFGVLLAREFAMSPWIYLFVISLDSLFCFPVFPAVLLHFCLSFPRDKMGRSRRKVLLAIYGTCLLAMGLYLANAVVYAPESLYLASMVGCLWAMAHTLGTERDPYVRVQIRWVVWAVVVTATVSVVLYVGPHFLGSWYRLGVWGYLGPFFSFVLLPGAIALSILRHRLFEIEGVFKRLVIHVLVLSGLVVLDFAASAILSRITGWRQNLSSMLFNVWLVALLYQPLRTRVSKALAGLLGGAGSSREQVLMRLNHVLLGQIDPASGLEATLSIAGGAFDSLKAAAWIHPPSFAMSSKSTPNHLPPFSQAEAQRIAGQLGKKALLVRDETWIPERFHSYDGLLVPVWLSQANEPVGFFLLAGRSMARVFLPTDREIAESIGATLGVFLEGLVLARRNLSLRNEMEGEKIRVSREIHDSVGSAFVAALSVVERASLPDQPLLSREDAASLQRLLRESLALSRDLMWTMDSEEKGTSDLALYLREKLAPFGLGSIRLVLDFEGLFQEESTGELPSAMRLHLLRIAQEAVQNSVKHSQAKEVRVEGRMENGRLVLTISDNGSGCDPQTVGLGRGWRNLRSRAESIGAELNITTQPGRGCQVRVVCPLIHS